MTRPRTLFIPMLIIMLVFLFVGCSDEEAGGEDKSSILESLKEVKSVDTSILLELDCHSGTLGEPGSHSASLTSDIALSAVFSPALSYHCESFSSITVDSINTREDKEYYVVPDDDVYYEYSYDADSDNWTVSTLSDSEIMGLPLCTGFITDWESIMENMDDIEEETSDDGELTTVLYEGDVHADILQNLFGNGIFDSMMFSMEYLLTDEIPCSILFNKGTGLPISMELDITDCFISDDMDIDIGYITVQYSNYNNDQEISVPKKVEIVAIDPVMNFYSSYGVWNLFMPYQDASQSINVGNEGLSFEAAWNTFQMRLDNGMAALPVSFSDLENIGYEIDRSSENKTVDANMTLSNVPVLKDNDVIYCTFYNDQTAAQPIALCKIVAVDLRLSACPDNSIVMYLPGEIKMGSTLEALLSAYGEPASKEQGFACDTYVWYNLGSDGTPIPQQSFLAEISPTTNTIVRLFLQNIPISANNVLATP